MKHRKTFTLRGEAAGEWVRAQSGVVPQTDNERALRIATVVHTQMLTGNEHIAIAIIKKAVADGLEKAAKACTLEKP